MSENTVTWPTIEQTKEAFDAYVSAVGKVAHAWNYLHEQLRMLFVVVSGAEREIALALDGRRGRVDETGTARAFEIHEASRKYPATAKSYGRGRVAPTDTITFDGTPRSDYLRAFR